MKRTNVVLDEALIRPSQALTGIKTIRGVVDHALRELVRRKRQKRIVELKGQIPWEGDLDALRRARRLR